VKATTPVKATPPVKAAAPAKAVAPAGPPVKAAPAKAAPAKAPAKPPVKPAATSAPAPAPTTRPYLVKDGDTLIGICAREKVDLPKVLALNHMHRDAVIHPGQKLLLPAPPPKPKPSNNTFLGRTYPPAVVAAADANRKALAKKSVPSREQVKVMIIATAKQQGLDPALALAIAYQESGFNQRVVSPANAVGVMQIIPSAGKWASSIIGQPLDLLDTKDNITAGVILLGALTKAADNEPQAIAGYYQGLSSVRNNGMYDDTRRYVANIQTLKSRFAKTL
jgi:soluble lytic murein transglycosylase-like protein